MQVVQHVLFPQLPVPPLGHRRHECLLLLICRRVFLASRIAIRLEPSPIYLDRHPVIQRLIASIGTSHFLVVGELHMVNEPDDIPRLITLAEASPVGTTPVMVDRERGIVILVPGKRAMTLHMFTCVMSWLPALLG